VCAGCGPAAARTQADLVFPGISDVGESQRRNTIPSLVFEPRFWSLSFAGPGTGLCRRKERADAHGLVDQRRFRHPQLRPSISIDFLMKVVNWLSECYE